MEAVAYFIKGVARELRIFPSFFQFFYDYQAAKREKLIDNDNDIETFKRRWLKHTPSGSYFDFNGAKIPDVSSSKEKLQTLKMIFEDVFLFPCFLNDNYEKYIVNYLDRFMGEGPYGYTDGIFDVTVKKNDVVIDAGAWIGDFSAYASSKGAVVYAFEPVNETYQWLCKTQVLNNLNGGIFPVPKGLSERTQEVNIAISTTNSGSNSILGRYSSRNEKILVTTLDQFVEENSIERVDFIKADIEGAEREMLKGATNVLKNLCSQAGYMYLSFTG
jgi:FkbM family methyltransferase